MPTSKRTRDAARHDLFPGTVMLIVNGVFVLWIVIPDNPRRLASWDMLLITGILAFILGLQRARQAPIKLDQTLGR